MLPGPLLLYLARTHSVIGAFHTKRANVNMRQNNRHQHKADDRMPKLRILHFLMRSQNLSQLAKAQIGAKASGIYLNKSGSKHLKLERKQQRHSGHRNRTAQNNHRPKNQFLTGIEFFRGWMPSRKDTTTFYEPVYIRTMGDIVDYPKNKN